MMKLQCIDIDILAAYIEGHLPNKVKNETEKHLMECDECLEEVILARFLLNDDELTEYEPDPVETARAALETFKQDAKRKVFKWLTTLSPPAWLRISPSPVRSSIAMPAAPTASVFIRKKINDLQTEMYVEKADDDNACIRIKVFKDSKPANNVSLTLIKDGKTPFARFLKDGHVLFEKQPFGNYTLNVEPIMPKSRKRLETAPYHFKINDAGFHEK